MRIVPSFLESWVGFAGPRDGGPSRVPGGQPASALVGTSATAGRSHAGSAHRGLHAAAGQHIVGLAGVIAGVTAPSRDVRMLASFDEADDAVQETFLRAWRTRDSFEGDALFRAWLYRIATNVCLDLIRARSRNTTEVRSFADVPWLQPYPDRLLDEIAPTDEQPDAVIVARETIELAFLAAMQLLPLKQRAALILRDVLGWPASETASLLEVSVAAANSALQRARATMRDRLPKRREDWSTREPSAEERRLLERFIRAHDRGDATEALAIASKDIRVTMPPHPFVYEGPAAIAALLEEAFGPDAPGDWRLVPTRANRLPTAASYLRAPTDTEFHAFKFDVLRIEHGRIAEITTFGASLFPAFDLPSTL
jgi:RNA polymerase sigma-70 factor (TIGR02960 family)